jgi:hypothetical protein
VLAVLVVLVPQLALLTAAIQYFQLLHQLVAAVVAGLEIMVALRVVAVAQVVQVLHTF